MPTEQTQDLATYTLGCIGVAGPNQHIDCSRLAQCWNFQENVDLAKSDPRTVIAAFESALKHLHWSRMEAFAEVLNKTNTMRALDQTAVLGLTARVDELVYR